MYERNSRGWVKHLDFILLDIVAITLAFFLAYGLRMGTMNLINDAEYRNYYLVIIGIHILVAFFFRSYTDIIRRGMIMELRESFKHCLLLMVGILFWLVFTKRALIYSRLVLFYFAAFAWLFMLVFRLLRKRAIRKKLISGGNKSELLLVTTRDRAALCVEALTKDPYQSYAVSGIVLLDGTDQEEKIDSVRVVANAENVMEYARLHVIDQVYVQVNAVDEKINDMAKQFLNMGIVVHFELGVPLDELPHKQIHQIANRTVITSSIQTANVAELFLKRAMDICGSLVGLVFTAIAFIFVAPAIYIKSPGPIFFSQVRVGRNGRQFKIYKFRSMYMDAEQRKQELMAQNEMQGLMFKIENDPRIIKGIGNFIRDTSIDELPQFFNILKGDMSLVGTRPPTLDEFRQYELHHKIRLSFRPGLTGMWQVSGRSDITDFEEVVRLDEKYIADWNIWLDIKILFKTIGVVLTGKGSK